ncbi:MAG: glycosyltransferase family 2 protein [Oscillochloridaceae bacterium umkhey_bin13]
MALIFDWLRAGLLVSELGLAVLVGYLLVLTVAALFAPQQTPLRANPTSRFAFLIPAHNEERLLPEVLANLQQLDYPLDAYTIFVVADNCSDATAAVARAGGAEVYERTNQVERGKGYALNWLIAQINARPEHYDAMIVLDADTVVSANFLRVMDARLARGERVIQSYYAVRDPEAAWSTAFRAAALTVLHYLRPQGRMVIGGTTGLKGNGMVFATALLRDRPFSGGLTEDIEYHMELVLDGERAMFAPDAVVWAEMPHTLKASDSQHARWERGRVEMLQRYVPQLLREAVRRRSFVLFDAAMEQLIPPFSVLVGASVAALGAGVVLRSKPAVVLGSALVGGQAIYVVTGLALAGAPPKTYQALLYAPVMMVWKILLYLRVLFGRGPQGWVRTTRND